MVDNTPKCRLCGYSLSASSGCTTCLEVKKFLIWPIESDLDSDLSAQSVIRTTLRVLKRRLSRLEEELSSEGQAYESSLTRDLGTISKALKELASEQRRLEDREQKSFSQLGLEGRMNLFIEQFFMRLPEDLQIQMLKQMKTTLQEQHQLPAYTDE